MNKRNKKRRFYLYKIFLEDSKNFIVVATTRPETLFGDCCLVVNPRTKYKNFIGKKVKVPLTDRVIQIVSDSYVDINKGSGALKITPAHDFNDFKIGKKLKISFF